MEHQRFISIFFKKFHFHWKLVLSGCCTGQNPATSPHLLSTGKSSVVPCCSTPKDCNPTTSPSCREALTWSQWVKHVIWRLGFVSQTSERVSNLKHNDVCNRSITPQVHANRTLSCSSICPGSRREEAPVPAERQRPSQSRWARRAAAPRQLEAESANPHRPNENSRGEDSQSWRWREVAFFFPRHHRVSHKYLVTSHFLGGGFQSRCADKTVLTAAFIRLPGCPLLHPISAPQISHCPCE